jgi:predicted kinase
VTALILMHGLPATGKTALARELARRLKAEILSSDLLRPRVFPDAPRFPPASDPEARIRALRRYRSEHPEARLNMQHLLRPLREAGYPIPGDLSAEGYRQREEVQVYMQAEAGRIAGQGRPVIVDATNVEYQATATDGRLYGRAVYCDIARQVGADFYIVSLQCRDESVIRARLASRVGREDDASRASTFDVFKGMRRIAERAENRLQAQEMRYLIALEIGTGELSTRLPPDDLIVGQVQQAWDAVRRRFS